MSQTLAPALTPRMAGVVDRMARARQPPFFTLTPTEAKAAYEKGAGVLEVPKPQLERVEDFTLPARDGHALLELSPVTGRKHQLRVHCQALSLPIVNDPFYPTLQPAGNDDFDRPLQLLARSLSFIDPLNGALRTPWYIGLGTRVSATPACQLCTL